MTALLLFCIGHWSIRFRAHVPGLDDNDSSTLSRRTLSEDEWHIPPASSFAKAANATYSPHTEPSRSATSSHQEGAHTRQPTNGISLNTVHADLEHSRRNDPHGHRRNLQQATETVSGLYVNRNELPTHTHTHNVSHHMLLLPLCSLFVVVVCSRWPLDVQFCQGDFEGCTLEKLTNQVYVS